jgi:hypothetical protein
MGEKIRRAAPPANIRMGGTTAMNDFKTRVIRGKELLAQITWISQMERVHIVSTASLISILIQGVLRNERWVT